ncbi:MAG: PrsW family intramembrane metalloprotease [Aeromicrobium sp.]|uniref:PrsW family intramembrane metalloprotease n=1 Tax=Aeromicrobium sp. TaxID=1871063 RepID=UPI0039E5C581
MTPATAQPVDPGETSGRRTTRRLLVVGVGLLAVAGVVMVGFFVWRSGSPEGAALAIALALVSVPFVGGFYGWVDRVHPQPARYVAAAFVWGAVGAVAIAVALSLAAVGLFDADERQAATFVAPVVEESAKGVFLLATFLRGRRVVRGLLDGLFYAGIVGLGFAFVENILYYTGGYIGDDETGLSGVSGATTIFVMRGVLSPFAHPMFCTSLGLAVGLAVMTKSWWARPFVVLGGWCGSVLLHLLWNGSASYGGGVGFVLIYLVLSVVFIAFLVFAVFLRHRRFAAMRRSLSYMAQRGWIPPEEIPWVTYHGYRVQAREEARRRAGREAAERMRRYQRLAADLAFIHDEVMLRRPVWRGVERTAALRAEMDGLREQVLWPAPIDALSQVAPPTPPSRPTMTPVWR